MSEHVKLYMKILKNIYEIQEYIIICKNISEIIRIYQNISKSVHFPPIYSS